jgi:acetyl esterase/lipase
MLRALLMITLLLAPKLLPAQYKKVKNISYLAVHTPGFDPIRHTLDVYYPSDTTKWHDVFVFIHGGSWKNGKKDSYRFLAKNMVRRGFVAVMINYRLSPNVKYESMVADCNAAVDWVTNNISSFGGDPDKITIAGHSAGGHLAAMVAMNKSRSQMPTYKVVLIDAFGLNMYSYFNSYHNDYAKSLYSIFSNDSSNWKKASPLYRVKPQIKTEFLVLAGSKTYPAILHSSEEFSNRVRAMGGVADYHVVARKKHIGMIIQLYFKKNKVYKLITDFITEKSTPPGT